MSRIPKIIHYCWFGGNPLPPLALRCIESWKKYCPDYELREWNENNFDVNYNAYAKEAYEAGKWAFVSDVARLWAVYSAGGIYFDTDVEIIKPIDDLLAHGMFIGFENGEYINTGQGFGAEKCFYAVQKMLDAYGSMSFVRADGTFDTTPCPVYDTEAMRREGFIINNAKQTLGDITVYPSEYFCPKDGKTGIVTITENTRAIHHFDGSWLTAEQKQEHEIVTMYRRKYGKTLGEAIYVIVAVCTFRRAALKNITGKIKCRISGADGTK